MREAIIYYYNFDDLEVKNYDNNTIQFSYKQNNYIFVPFERSVNDLKWVLTCSQELNNIGFNCHKIVLNKFGNVLSSLKNDNYILLCIVGDLQKRIDISDMVTNSKKYLVSSKNSTKSFSFWSKLWERKVDYLEDQVKVFGNTKEKILYNFSYYLGMAENAISYYSNLNHSFVEKLTLAHRRVFFPNIWLNYGNPLSFCFDVRARDYAEYIKSAFFYNSAKSGYENFDFLLKIESMDKYSLELLLSRLLFPSYYFDTFEEIVLKNADENNLIKIVEKANDYEHFLKYCYNKIKERVDINSFPLWLL